MYEVHAWKQGWSIIQAIKVIENKSKDFSAFDTYQ